MTRWILLSSLMCAGLLACGPSQTVATPSPTTTVAAEQGVDALRTLLSRRHYTPAKADIEAVSADAAGDLRTLAAVDEGLGIIRTRSIWSLALYPSDVSAEALMVLVKTAPRPALRRGAIAALGRMDAGGLSAETLGDVASSALLAVQDEDLQVRLAAVDTLSVLPNSAALLHAAKDATQEPHTRTRIDTHLQDAAVGGVAP
ncbi:MAG: hypothetical protein ACI9MR_000142 [Myxococcota bacterium]|jgi:hypothetical protein